MNKLSDENINSLIKEELDKLLNENNNDNIFEGKAKSSKTKYDKVSR